MATETNTSPVRSIGHLWIAVGLALASFAAIGVIANLQTMSLQDVGGAMIIGGGIVGLLVFSLRISTFLQIAAATVAAGGVLIRLIA